MHHIVMNGCTFTNPLHNESDQPCLSQCMNLLHHTTVTLQRLHQSNGAIATCISPHYRFMHPCTSIVITDVGDVGDVGDPGHCAYFERLATCLVLSWPLPRLHQPVDMRTTMPDHALATTVSVQR